MTYNTQSNQRTNLEKVFVPHAYSHVVAIVNPKSGERQASDFVYDSLCEALADPHKVHRLDADSFRDTTRMREMIKSYCVLFSEVQEVVPTEEVADIRRSLAATKHTSVVEILSTRKDIGSDDDLAENLGNRRPSSNVGTPKAMPKDISGDKKQINNSSTSSLPPGINSISSPSEYASADRGTVVVAGGDGTVCFIMGVVDTVREELEALVATERKSKVQEAVKALVASGVTAIAPLTITVRSPVIPAVGVIAMGTGNDLSNSLGYGLGYTKYPAPPCCCLCCDACVHVVKDILDSLVLKAVAVPFDRWQVSVTPIRELVTDVVSEAIFDEDETKKETPNRSSMIYSTSTADCVSQNVNSNQLQVPSSARRRTLSIAFDAELIGKGALRRSSSALHLQASSTHRLPNANAPNLRTLLEGQSNNSVAATTNTRGKKRTTVVVDTQRFRAHHNGAERAGIFSDTTNDEHTLVMASSFYRFAKSTSDVKPNNTATTQKSSPTYSPTGGDVSTSTADISNSYNTINSNTSTANASQPLSPPTRLVVEERLVVPTSPGAKQTDAGGRRRKSVLEVSAASPTNPPSPATVLPPGGPNSHPAVGPKPIRRFIAMNYFSLGMDAYIATTFDTLRKQHPSLFNSRLMNKMWYGSLGLYGWAKSDRLDDNIYFIDVATEEGVTDGVDIALTADKPPPLPLQHFQREEAVTSSAAEVKPSEILLPRSSLDIPSTAEDGDRLEMRTPPANKRSTIDDDQTNALFPPPVLSLPPLPTPIHFPPKTKCLVLSNVGSYSGGAKLWKTTDKAASKAADSRRTLMDRIRKNTADHCVRLSSNSTPSPAPSDDGQLEKPLVSNKHAHANSGANTPTSAAKGRTPFDPYNGLSDENLAILNGAKGYEHVSTNDNRIEVQAVGGLLDMMLLQSKMTPTKPMAQSQVIRIVVGHPDHHPSKVATRIANTVEELRRKQAVVESMTAKAKVLAAKQYHSRAMQDKKALSQAGRNRPELFTRYLDPQHKEALMAEHEAAIIANDKDLAAAKVRVEALRSLLEVAPDWTIGVSRQKDATSDNSDVIGSTPIDRLRKQRPETLQEALASAIHSEVLGAEEGKHNPKTTSNLTLNHTLKNSVCFQVDGEPSGYITEPSLIEVRPYPKQMLVRSLTAIKM